MNKILCKFMKLFGSVAIAIAFISANTTSVWYINQPEMPKSLKDKL
ncbi:MULTISPECIES: cyclic lactone autoinducer peptide [unclassified Clostridioides]|nr:cyclic lactone autoinducer peptide [Clostridioides sp. ZZV14-6150]MCC0667880.1 cyclic lactone autoinducer peptide [Clostridioides sp. ZZV14-6153]MCC0723692.1 cyclic lactone autoinducer peptide [Clostridioides sp. ZZV14-6104]MCC0724878.1 cyclic lactone autoinducer peptide [Clostridioides sp. ZZV14-6045]MCC0730750.1 cyclic lactone autoinducer peptide [Clostridioides sp. ZZV14-6048]MCC0736699.1 cyclic lactone autoinducer peptide [Clostridioides sp. ZZV14-6009]MCC0741487.1 cyclic lactone autoi